MSVIVFPDVKPIKHPGKRMSEDEMRARSVCDLKDPNARFPTHCSECRQKSTALNPMRLVPVTRDMKDLVRAYLYRAICANCTFKNGRH